MKPIEAHDITYFRSTEYIIIICTRVDNYYSPVTIFGICDTAIKKKRIEYHQILLESIKGNN